MSNTNWSNHAAHVGLTVGVLLNRVAILRAEKEDRLEDAKEDYYQALRALESATDDHALKEEAFVRGIVYAGLMRDAGDEHKFDEENVAEDIQRVLRIGQKRNEQPRGSAVERLRELEGIRQAGLITEEEYRNKRAEILASI